MSVPVVFAIAGVIALFLSVWGGGIKAKEIEIPQSSTNARLIVGAVGFIFIGISIWLSSPISSNNVPPDATSTPALLTSTPFTPIPATAQSTETPSPSPTVTTAPTLTVEEQALELLKAATHSWKQVVLDTFDGNNYKWPVGEQRTGDEQDLATISINGKYHVDIQTGDGGGWWLMSKIQTPETFYLATDARRTSTQPGCIIGLRWSTPNGNYLFDVYDDEKNYRLEVYDREISENDGWRDVIPKTTSTLILTQDVNRLSVIHDGTYIWLYINDQFLNRAKSEYANRGDIGYYVSVCQENAQVTFELDNLEVRRP